MFKSPLKYFLLTIALIAIDQAIKLWMHFSPENVQGNEFFLIGHWFKLHYVLNDGMAFGMKLDFVPGGYGKMVLTIFRIFAMFGIGWYLTNLAKNGAHSGLLWSIAAILGGAIGNVIDSTFYGVFLHNAPAGVPMDWFHGQVIDMFYVDPWQGFLPDWVPIWGGSYYSNPIFNFADACIFCGVMSILIFQNRFFAEKKQALIQEESIENEEDTIETASPSLPVSQDTETEGIESQNTEAVQPEEKKGIE